MTDEEKDSPEIQVARLFRLAGHEVTQSVGEEPGAVDWFATPREGFVRPRTYWRAWKTCPDRLDEALSDLEQARIARHADRALGVAMEGLPPEGYRSDLASGTTNAVTYRELLLALAGITEQVREYVDSYERSYAAPAYVSRRARIQQSGEVDAVALIEKWAASEESSNLMICGTLFSGRTSVASEAMHRIGKRFLKNPADVIPVVWPRNGDAAREAYLLGWAIPVRERGSDQAREDVPLGQAYRSLFISTDATPGEHILVDLVPVESGEIDAWFHKRIDVAHVHERFVQAREQVPAFMRISDSLPNLGPLLDALRTKKASANCTLLEWVAWVVAAYVDAIGSGSGDMGGASVRTMFDILESAAIEQFGLRKPSLLTDARLIHVSPKALAAAISTWTTPPLFYSPYAWRQSTSRDPNEISNVLIFHYFVARKIAREVRAGNLDILTRYQFPSEYVLLFLAILAPDVAAQATAERGEAIRTQIESRLQLTLAHALKRSAGAVRSHMKAIQRHVDRATPGALEHEFTRVEEEVTFQCALAEQTRLWHEVPESEVEGLVLESYLSAVAADLRSAHPHVAYETSIDPALRVRATREVLREILHCLLENAFQAVAFAGELVDPRVRVEAHVEGGTIRLDILDSGPGVAPGDREHIFDLYVTTKKGGPNKPLGTGMGLPIAHRYAEHVGGQVGLDPARELTCFFVRFVAWRDIG
jgi:signal transduction histidine kinase